MPGGDRDRLVAFVRLRVPDEERELALLEIDDGRRSEERRPAEPELPRGRREIERPARRDGVARHAVLDVERELLLEIERIADRELRHLDVGRDRGEPSLDVGAQVVALVRAEPAAHPLIHVVRRFEMERSREVSVACRRRRARRP